MWAVALRPQESDDTGNVGGLATASNLPIDRRVTRFSDQLANARAELELFGRTLSIESGLRGRHNLENILVGATLAAAW